MCAYEQYLHQASRCTRIPSTASTARSARCWTVFWSRRAGRFAARRVSPAPVAAAPKAAPDPSAAVASTAGVYSSGAANERPRRASPYREFSAFFSIKTSRRRGIRRSKDINTTSPRPTSAYVEYTIRRRGRLPTALVLEGRGPSRKYIEEETEIIVTVNSDTRSLRSSGWQHSPPKTSSLAA